jgi:hypothetical protein
MNPAGEWEYTESEGSRRYYRANATVFVNTKNSERCRWETTEPRAEGFADDAWAAMGAADAADGYVWKCPHCDDPDPDGELHMYCGHRQSHPHGSGCSPITAAIANFDKNARQMQQALGDILHFQPSPEMSIDQVVERYQELAQQGLQGV